MSDIEKRKADRLRVMDAMYTEAGANTQALVQLWPMREALGFSDEHMGEIVDYLEGEGLIDTTPRTMTGTMTPMNARITHEGVKEMERSEESPNESTTHFPARESVNITIDGSVYGSPFQVASPGATQHAEVGDITIGAQTEGQIREFLAAYESKLPELRQEQTSEALAEVGAEVATISAQIDSPKPKKPIIRECLKSIRTILEIGAGGAMTVGLLALIAVIFI